MKPIPAGDRGAITLLSFSTYPCHMADQIDYTKIQAKEAYLDKENGRCRLNPPLCEGGDCRTCNFITDSSLMLVLENIMHELKHMQGECGCEEHGCGCDCGCE